MAWHTEVRIIPQPEVLEKILDLKSLIESLLFVADRAVTAENLSTALDVSVDDVKAALQALSEAYQGRGIRLQRRGDRRLLVSAP